MTATTATGVEARLGRLQEVTSRLATLVTPEEAARIVVEDGAAAVGATTAAVYAIGGDEVRIIASSGFKAAALERFSALPLDGDAAAAVSAREHRVIEMTDRRSIAEMYGIPIGVPIDQVQGSFISLPLVAEGRTLGSLVLARMPEGPFEPGERVVIDVLALACAQALARAISMTAERKARTLVDAIVDTAPEGFALFDRDLRYVRVNPALARINGISAEEHVGRTLAEIVPEVPDSGALEPLRRVLATGEAVEIETTGRTSGDPHNDHTWLVSYYPIRDDEDEITAIGAFVVDITDRKRAEQRAELLARISEILDEVVPLERRLDGAAHCLIERLCDSCAITVGGGDMPELTAIATVDPDAVPRGTFAVPLLARGEEIGRLEIGVLREHALAAHEREVAEAVAERLAIAIDGWQLFESERAARERTTRMQAVTAALSEALTPQDVATAILAYVLPAVGADAGTVFQLDADNVSALLVGQHGYLPKTLEPYRRISLDQRLHVSDAMRTGRARWMRDLDERTAAYPDLTSAFGQVVPGGLAVLPLAVPGRIVGALTLAFTEARSFDDEERAFLLGVASQCGQALDRARLYESERRVAATLQRSLLPARLPSLESVDVAVRYLPAAGLEAGGDFYEVIRLPDGSIGMAVGDVVGRGASAAAVMGQMRAALRAFAMGGASPGEVLRSLSGYAETVDGALAATAVYGVLEPSTGVLRYACAGHPWPLVVDRDGTARFLRDGRAVPLACMADPGTAEGEVVLEPGMTLLLYTDGLTDRRGVDAEAAHDALLRAASARGGEDLHALLDGVVLASGGDELLDDVALLAVRLAVPEHHLRFEADPRNVRDARNALRVWLQDAAVDAETAADILLAAGEAVANAVEHAYHEQQPGMVEMTLQHDPEGRHLLVVRDFGNWRKPGGSVERGRGLGLIRAVMEDVEVDVTASGTTVRMRRAARRPAAPAVPVPGTKRPKLGIEERDGVVFVAVAGDVDLGEAPDVARRLKQAAGSRGLVVDLAPTTFLDSTGARMLVETSRELAGRMAVAAPPAGPARRVLDASGLGGLLGLHDDAEAAAASLR